MAPRREVIRTERFSISYLVAGDGPPVVIIPSIEQTAEWWAEVGYLDLLAPNHRVAIVDPIGHGEADLVDTISFAQPEPVVNALATLFEYEGIKAATVWGCSIGAEYATVLARRRPDLAAKVVVGSMYLGDERLLFQEMKIDRQRVFDRLAQALEDGDWAAFFDISPTPTDSVYQAEVRRRNDPQQLAARVRAWQSRGGGFVLPGVSTFAYWGEGEPFHSANVDRVESMPISWATMPGARSDVFMAAARVVDLVEGFLRPVNARV